MKQTVASAICALLDYAENRGLTETADRTYCFNRLLQLMQLDAPDGELQAMEGELADILEVLK